MDQPKDDAENQSFADAFEASLQFKTPEQGDLLRGTIVSISGDDAFVTYGGPTEAIISAAEIPECKVGDTVEATVTQTTPEIRLSRKMMAKRASMDALRQAYESRIPVEGKITGRNKGGFDVSVSGLRAFCPLSQIELGKIENPDAFVGQTYEFRLTEFSEDGRKVVVSRTAILKEAAAVRMEEMRKTIGVGSVLTGKVKTIVPFGAFVDLGGVEGLLHVSEMSRRRVNDPKEIVQVGQELSVKVVKIEGDGKRISLSIKDQEPDPWKEAAERYQAGMPFSGKIARKTDFGLFVELEPGLDGLLHVSQLPLGTKLDDESLAVGASISGWVREVDQDKRRLSLAMREVAVSDPWEGIETAFPAGRVVEGTVERVGPAGIFVQLAPGLTGLIPLGEIETAPGADPGKMFPAGEKVKVKVLAVDAQRRRISLSHSGAKAAEERGEYLEYVQEAKPDANAADGKSAMAIAFEKALETRNN